MNQTLAPNFYDYNAIRPLVFANDDQIYPYSLSGSCCFVSHSGSAYAVTARHALHDYHPRQLRLLADPDAGSVFTFSTPWAPEGEMNGSLNDFAIFPLEENPAEVGRHVNIWDITEIHQPVPAVDEEVLVSGYPCTTSEVNYENGNLTFTEQTLKGSYIESSSEIGVFTGSLQGPLPYSTLSGLSGGAVTMQREIDGRNAATLLGICIMAGIESMRFHYIGILAVSAFINEHLR